MAYTTIDKPTDYFNTVLYTGNGASSHAITGVGFQPDWNWHKIRNDTDWHMIHDSIRLATNAIYSNANNIQGTQATGLKSFDSDGFTVGSLNDSNQNNGLFVSWNWLAGGSASSNSNGSITSSVSASTDAGFSIVSYTGTLTSATNTTVGHGLGAVPKMIIIKSTSNAENWGVQHTGLTANYMLQLNTTAAQFDTSSDGTLTNPTSSVFTINYKGEWGNNGQDYIAYCFADVKGYSKFGSYTGNGNADGTYVHLGFKPAFFICKRTSDAGYDWLMYDNKRQVSFNVIDDFLKPNLSDAETTGNANQSLDFLSNGVKHRGNGASSNGSGASYIYMAFAESPFVTGSSAIPTNAR